MSPGVRRRKENDATPKCPIHTDMSNHFLKGCYKLRNLTQAEKFDLMNTHEICHRCGHNNCVAGKHPFNYDDCQFIANCQIPTCGMNTHFSSICPRVYGLDGYNHFDRQSTRVNALNAGAENFLPSKSQLIYKNSNPTSESSRSDKERITCALPTVMGYIRHGGKKTKVRILLDTGSQISLIREGIIPQSDTCHMQDFNLTTVGGNTVSHKLCVVECTLESLDGTFNRDVRLTEVKRPCGDAQIVTNSQLRHYPHLEDIDIVEAHDETIDVLLGVENGDILTSEERVLGTYVDDPVAVRCPLGWYIQGGRSTEYILATNAVVNFTQVSAISDIQDFLGIERVGVEPRHCKCVTEEEDHLATQTMKESVVQLDDGTYQIRLPWRKSPQSLPNNYDYAVKRFLSLEKQFQNKPHEWEVYSKVMDDQLNRGVARIVPTSEFEADISQGQKMWFLPHFAVVKDSVTTPVRVVYDGKARYQGHSLNDYFAKGDNLNVNIFDVALRFREYEVGVIADISKMFQAAKVTTEDARFHRYVFRKHPSDPIQVYELLTVTFGDKPSPTAAIVVLRHVAAHNAPDDSEVQRVVANQFYVDDLNDSQRSTEGTLRLKQNLTVALDRGNFKIRKWLSNKSDVSDTEYYPKDDIAMALGTRWNLVEDTLSVKEVTLNECTPTKRNILKTTASYYDVFGMLSGILVRPKMLLQKLWTFDIDWDTPISPDSDLFHMWESVKRDLKDVGTVKIERCLIPEKFRGMTPLPEVSLHGASDASEDAMGIGVWLRWSAKEDDDAQLSFVCARARLTPLKQTSMPRKELQAIILLSRMMITVENALRIEIAYKRIWTDSMTAISWLRGQSKSFRSFVACRVGEITYDFDPITDIAYVPSGQNVIDLVSRGVDVSQLQKVIDGPGFLKLPPVYWPTTPKNVPVDRDDAEQKNFHVRNAKVLTLNVTRLDPIVDPTKFSSWPRLIRMTARVMSLKDLPRTQWLK